MSALRTLDFLKFHVSYITKNWRILEDSMGGDPLPISFTFIWHVIVMKRTTPYNQTHSTNDDYILCSFMVIKMVVV